METLIKDLGGKIFVGGDLIKSSSPQMDVLNPATGEVIAQVPNCTELDVDLAVKSAYDTFPKWAAFSARERGKLLGECARSLKEHQEELARLVTYETGKAIRTESRVEAAVFTDMLEFFGGLASELKGETVPFNPNMLTMTLRQPLGVVGGIIPWNVPLMLMAMKIAPALIAGNTVVIKSSEYAPLGVLRAVQIMGRILPKGVLNLISGVGSGAGEELTKHPLVKKITFTGSVATGRKVYHAAAEKLVPVTLELGGKSPMLVFGDAHLDKAIEGAFVGMRFTRQGQSCSASSRIFVHKSLYEPFLDGLKKKLEALVIGDPFDEKTDVGAVISKDQYDKIDRYLALARQDPNITVYQCNQRPKDPQFQKGFFHLPTILTGVPRDHSAMKEEIFGPVVCVTPFEDTEEVLKLANDTSFGLAATVWTKDLSTALQMSHRLEAGFVQVNQNLVVQAGLSYGGVKESGLGKEASLEAMLEHFTHKKTVILNMTS